MLTDVEYSSIESNFPPPPPSYRILSGKFSSLWQIIASLAAHRGLTPKCSHGRKPYVLEWLFNWAPSCCQQQQQIGEKFLASLIECRSHNLCYLLVLVELLKKVLKLEEALTWCEQIVYFESYFKCKQSLVYQVWFFYSVFLWCWLVSSQFHLIPILDSSHTCVSVGIELGPTENQKHGSSSMWLPQGSLLQGRKGRPDYVTNRNRRHIASADDLLRAIRNLKPFDGTFDSGLRPTDTMFRQFVEAPGRSPACDNYVFSEPCLRNF